MAREYNKNLSLLEKRLLSQCIWQEDVDAFKETILPGMTLKQKKIELKILKCYPHIVMTSEGCLSWLDLYQFNEGLIRKYGGYDYRSITTKDLTLKEKVRERGAA